MHVLQDLTRVLDQLGVGEVGAAGARAEESGREDEDRGSRMSPSSSSITSTPSPLTLSDAKASMRASTSKLPRRGSAS